MHTIGRTGAGWLMASLAAGPIYCLFLLVAGVAATLPQAIIIKPNDLAMSAALLPVATVVGAIIAFVPNIVGTGIMHKWGAVDPAAREPLCWGVVGGAIIATPLVIIRLAYGPFDDADTNFLCVALVLTAFLCALICRRTVNWDDHAEDKRAFAVQLKDYAADPDPRILR